MWLPTGGGWWRRRVRRRGLVRRWRILRRRRQLRRRRRVGRLVTRPHRQCRSQRPAASAGISRPITATRAARFRQRRSRAIEAAIAEGEQRHRGQVRFVVEAALPLARVLRARDAARARARGVRPAAGLGYRGEQRRARLRAARRPRRRDRRRPRHPRDASATARVGGDLPEDGSGVPATAASPTASSAGSPRSTRCLRSTFRATARGRNELPDKPGRSSERRCSSASVRESRPRASARLRVPLRTPGARRRADQVQRVALRLIGAVAQHDERHRRRHEQPEQHDRAC